MKIKQMIETVKIISEGGSSHKERTLQEIEDLMHTYRTNVIKICIEEVNKEIAAVQSRPEMYAQQMRILSLQDARDRLVKLLSNVE
ncbi:MAG: hypothetical protein RBT33_04015 [Candidatus Dojkabacteria bacterium]|jgi:hypothetical protein|nr:hypothetical protein [Candidatus Dojkabacteria bacterium]